MKLQVKLNACSDQIPMYSPAVAEKEGQKFLGLFAFDTHDLSSSPKVFLGTFVIGIEPIQMLLFGLCLSVGVAEVEFDSSAFTCGSVVHVRQKTASIHLGVGLLS